MYFFHQAIYGTYIVQDSREDIGIPVSTRKKIYKSIIPPFDELFDEAEEHILKVLIVPWNKLLSVDHATYSKVGNQRNIFNNFFFFSPSSLFLDSDTFFIMYKRERL